MNNQNFKGMIAKLRYEALCRTIKNNQKEQPKTNLVGAHLREYVAGIPTGHIRQEMMKEFFKQKAANGDGYVCLAVNGRWFWNTKDKDLQALIKSGFLKVGREVFWGKTNKRTYLSWSGSI